jgi:hypothetical protein
MALLLRIEQESDDHDTVSQAIRFQFDVRSGPRGLEQKSCSLFPRLTDEELTGAQVFAHLAMAVAMALAL